MPDTDAVLAQINTRLGSIDKHLERQNGRIGKLEDSTKENSKAVAVISTRCALISDHERETFQRIEQDQRRTEERIFDFIKENALQIGNVGALVFLIGKYSGWW